jgi:hypothetical protein
VADQSADLLFTDPIYATHVEDIEAFAAWVHPWLAKVKPTGRALIFTGAYPREIAAYLRHFLDPASGHAVHGFTLDTPAIWTFRNTIGPAPTHTFKLNYQLIWHLFGPQAPPLDCPLLIEQFSVQDVPAPDGRGDLRLHAWEKPALLLERLILFTTAPGALVVDPFCGTGAHLAAAAKLGRIGLGGDIDPAMVARSRARGLAVVEGRAAAPAVGDLRPVRPHDQEEVR